MRHSLRVLLVGFTLLFGAIAFDLVGASFQILGVIIFSFILAISGAVVAVRGMLEYLSERFQ
jgi:hypothetical protein